MSCLNRAWTRPWPGARTLEVESDRCLRRPTSSAPPSTFGSPVTTYELRRFANDLIDAIAMPKGRDFQHAWKAACLFFGRFDSEPTLLTEVRAEERSVCAAIVERQASIHRMRAQSYADDGDRADGEAQSDDIEREESIAEALEYVASRMRHRNRPESPDGSNHSTLSNSPPRPDDERISLKLEPIVLANEAQRPMLWQIVRRLVEEGNVPRTDNPRVDGDRERADRLQNEVHTLKRALDSSPDRAKQYLAMSRDDVARLTKENQRMAKRIGSLRKALAVAEGREPRSGTAMPAWKCDHSTRDVTPDGRSCRACTAESFRSLMSELVCAWDRYSPDEDVGMVGLVSKIEAIRAFIGGAGE